jgi:hypothetical protein
MTKKNIKFKELIRFPDTVFEHATITPIEKMFISSVILSTRPKTIVETGVWKGKTTKFISELLYLNNIDSKIYGFDFPNVVEDLLDSDSFFKKQKNIEFIKGTLPISMNNWFEKNPDKKIDFAIVDATHSFQAVREELLCILPRISDGGYVFCHDYGELGSKYESVMYAVNEISKSLGFNVLPLHSKDPISPEYSSQAALLRRPTKYSFFRKIFHFRKYYALKYSTLASIWGTIRKNTI